MLYKIQFYLYKKFYNRNINITVFSSHDHQSEFAPGRHYAGNQLLHKYIDTVTLSVYGFSVFRGKIRVCGEIKLYLESYYKIFVLSAGMYGGNHNFELNWRISNRRKGH